MEENGEMKMQRAEIDGTEFEFNPKLTLIWGRSNTGKTRLLKQIYEEAQGNPGLTTERSQGEPDFRDAIFYPGGCNNEPRYVPSLDWVGFRASGRVEKRWEMFCEFFTLTLDALTNCKITARKQKKNLSGGKMEGLSIVHEKSYHCYEELLWVGFCAPAAVPIFGRDSDEMRMANLWSPVAGSVNRKMISLAYSLAKDMVRVAVKHGAKDVKQALQVPMVAFIDDLDSYDAFFYNRRTELVSGLLTALPNLSLIATVRNHEYLCDRDISPQVILIQQRDFSKMRLYSGPNLVRTLVRHGKRLLDYPSRKDYFPLLRELDTLSDARFAGMTGEEIVARYYSDPDYTQKDYHGRDVRVRMIGGEIMTGSSVDEALKKNNK